MAMMYRLIFLSFLPLILCRYSFIQKALVINFNVSYKWELYTIVSCVKKIIFPMDYHKNEVAENVLPQLPRDHLFRLSCQIKEQKKGAFISDERKGHKVYHRTSACRHFISVSAPSRPLADPAHTSPKLRRPESLPEQRDYSCEPRSLAEAASGWGGPVHLAGWEEKRGSCVYFVLSKSSDSSESFTGEWKKRGDFNWKLPVQELSCIFYTLSPVFALETIHYWTILKSRANGGNFCIK